MTPDFFVAGRLDADASSKTGILARHAIEALVHRKRLSATVDFERNQFQPASLDLRLGAKAYRVRASFLPGRERTVAEQLQAIASDEISLKKGAVLERGCVYEIGRAHV